MRNKLLVLSLVLLAASVGAWALVSWTLVADVPFAFYANDKWYPAGEYKVQKHDMHLVLTTMDSRDGVMFLTHGGLAVKSDTIPSLVFTRYPDSNRHFLKEVVNPDLPYSFELGISKTEKEQVSSRVIASAKPERVIISARLR